MNKQLLLSEFLTTPWALMPERLQAMTGVLSRWQAGDLPSEETMLQVNADRLIRESRKQFASANAGAGIAVLPLYGVVTQRGNMVDDISGLKSRPVAIGIATGGRVEREARCDLPAFLRGWLNGGARWGSRFRAVSSRCSRSLACWSVRCSGC